MRLPTPYSLLTLALAVLLAGLLDQAGPRLLAGVEQRVADVMVRRHAAGLAADADIVVVDIDEASLTALAGEAGKWPWPRALHAELIDGIMAQGPRAIVFDMTFAEADLNRPDSDRLFAEAVARSGRVWLPLLQLEAAGAQAGAPLADLAPLVGAVATPAADPAARAVLLLPAVVAPQHWNTGAINFLADADGVARRYPLYLETAGWRIPSLPAALAGALGYSLPDGATLRLAWRGGRLAHPRVSHAELYADLARRERQRPADEFAGKIVVIGATAAGLHDLKPSPIHPQHPGTEILATAIDNLKNGRQLHALPEWAGLAGGGALLLALLAAFGRRQHTLRIGGALAGVSLVLAGAAYFAVGRLWLLPLAVPLALAWGYYFAAALAEYLRERRQREQAVRQFARFVNPHVVRQLVERGGFDGGGQSREVTLLFSDIRGYTTLSEGRSPEEVVAFLNRYFGRQVETIFRHDGSLDKFIGDAIMALWGAPLDDPDHARHAVAAALDMADNLEAFRAEIGGELGRVFDVGIGIHSGPAVVGLIGPEARREYTAIGDTVNLASRIEGLTKGVARILVSEDTMRRCGDAFDFTGRGSYKVKGREQEVRLYEPRRKSA